ncbi:MAG: L-threonylcarbamoyladenylate synthase [Propionibacteriaceae bacterium]
MTEPSDEKTPRDDDAPAEDAELLAPTPDDAPVVVETPEPSEPAPTEPAEPEPSEPAPTEPAEPEPTEPEREPVVIGGSDLPSAILSVRQAIRAGESVVFPTDTVYGIAADPFSPQAVQGLLDAKHRGRDMPPPVLIGDPEVIDAYATDVPAAARILMSRHWPGPLTLILSAQSSLRMDLGETKGSIGVRVPDHEVARAILRATGPLAVSSANVSGEPAATDVHDALRQLGSSVAVYVDGGATPGPTPSTIVDFASGLAGKVVRIGAISLEKLREDLPGLEGPVPDPPLVAEPPEEVSAAPDGVVTPDGVPVIPAITDESSDTPPGETTQAAP